MEKLIAKRAKKVVALIGITVLCFSLGGCSSLVKLVASNLKEESVVVNDDTNDVPEIKEEENKSSEEISEEISVEYEWKDYDVELSEDIMDFEIAIDGEVYKFPMWFKDFEEKGWEFKDDRTIELSSYDYEVCMEWERNGVRAETDIYNLSLNNATLENSLVTELVINYYDLQDLKVSVEFPCDIIVGKSTKEDIINAYGEPDDIIDRLDEEQLCYDGPEYDQTHNFLVNKDTGIFTNFILENVSEVEGLNNEVSAEVPEDVANYIPPTELSDSLNDVTFKLDEVVYELPCPTAYFLENGFTIAEDYENEVVPAGSIATIYFRYDNKEISAMVRNTTGKATTPEHCWVIEFYAFSTWTELNLNMILPEGLVVGMTEEEVLAILDGKYNYEPVTKDGHDYFIYEDMDTRYDKNIIAYFVDGVLKGFWFNTDKE